MTQRPAGFRRVSDGTPLAFNTNVPSVNIEPQYPADFFATEKKKPSVEIWNATLKQATWLARDHWDNATWNDKNICTFLVTYIRENKKDFTAVSEEEYKSFNMTIADANEEYSPLSYLNLTGNEDSGAKESVGDDAESRRSLFVGIMCVARHIWSLEGDGTKQQGFLNVVLKKLELAPWGLNKKDEHKLMLFKSSTFLTRGYLRVLCAVDAFFFKNAKMDCSSIRLCTLQTRYRGCIAFRAYSSACDSTGIKSGDLPRYFLHDQLVTEGLRLLAEGQDSEDTWGYFPYQLEMGLVRNSAYSLGACPTIGLFLRALDAFAGNESAWLSRYPNGAKVPHVVIKLAYLVARVVVGNQDLELKVAYTDEEQQALKAYNEAIEATLNPQQGASATGSSQPPTSGLPPNVRPASATASAPTASKFQLPNSVNIHSQNAAKILLSWKVNNGLTAREHRDLVAKVNGRTLRPPGSLAEYMAGQFV
uniref:Nucleoprotein n=1 Tax=Tongliao Rhabd tick virus 1 TaxID=2972331 RepID=A0A9E8A9P0_9RHAB|nr:MAG: nucleoprotein [Tongliao Rhabd tick virus 1]